MADDFLNTLQSALNTEVQQQQQTDWGNILANALAQGAQGAMAGFAEAKPNDYGSQLASALVGGLSTGYGQARQRDIRNDVLSGLADSVDATKAGQYGSLAEALTANNLDNISNAVTADNYNFDLGLDRTEQEQKLKNKMALQLSRESVPIAVDEYTQKQKIAGNQAINQLKQQYQLQLKNEPELTREKTKNQYLGQLQGLQEAQETGLISAGSALLTPEERMKQEDALRGEINKLDITKDLVDIESMFNTMTKLQETDTRAADIQFIGAFARINDPGSTVREGEFAISESASPILQRMAGTLNYIVAEGGKLTPETKKEMIKAAAAKYNVLNESYNAATGQYQDIAKRRGLDVKNIMVRRNIPNYQSTDLSNYTPEQQKFMKERGFIK